MAQQSTSTIYQLKQGLLDDYLDNVTLIIGSDEMHTRSGWRRGEPPARPYQNLTLSIEHLGHVDIARVITGGRIGSPIHAKRYGAEQAGQAPPLDAAYRPRQILPLNLNALVLGGNRPRPPAGFLMPICNLFRQSAYKE